MKDPVQATTSPGKWLLRTSAQLNPTQRAQGARKNGVQPGTTPVPDNKLQHVATEKRQQSSSQRPCPEDSDVASSAPKEAVEYTVDAEAASKGASFCATAGTTSNEAHQTSFIPAQKGPQESLQLDACNAPMCLLTEKVTTRWLMPRLGSVQLVL